MGSHVIDSSIEGAGGGGGGGAPTNASYVTTSAEAGLSNEKVITSLTTDITTTGDITGDELILTIPSQDYKLTSDPDTASALALQAQTSGQNSRFTIRTKDNDGTDTVELTLSTQGLTKYTLVYLDAAGVGGLTTTSDMALISTGDVSILAVGGDFTITSSRSSFTGSIDMTGGAGAYFRVPSLTTVQRDGLTAANGMLIYNTTAGKFQGYEAGAWVNLI